MRINSHASEQYLRNATPVEKPREKATAQAHARTKTTSFGFTMGKFGLHYESQSTQLDPSLSRDVRQQKQKAQSFNAERDVESLRATIGREGASFRNREMNGAASTKPTATQLRTGLAAYARNSEEILPPPGAMLAGVV